MSPSTTTITLTKEALAMAYPIQGYGLCDDDDDFDDDFDDDDDDEDDDFWGGMEDTDDWEDELGVMHAH